MSQSRIRIGNADPDPVGATDTIVYDFYCTSVLLGPLLFKGHQEFFIKCSDSGIDSE